MTLKKPRYEKDEFDVKKSNVTNINQNFDANKFVPISKEEYRCLLNELSDQYDETIKELTK